MESPIQIGCRHRNDIPFFRCLNNNMATQTNQNQLITPSKGEIILYQTADGRTSIDVKLDKETVWLTQNQLVLLFERDKSVISRHIKNIFSEGELDPQVVVAKNAITTQHGAIQGKTQTHEVILYNLDVIISVGYRVKSKRGTQFRIWANSVLKDYLIRGYAVRNDLVQQKYDDLKALVDVMGRTMGYLDSPADDQIHSIFDVVILNMNGFDRTIVRDRDCRQRLLI